MFKKIQKPFELKDIIFFFFFNLAKLLIIFFVNQKKYKYNKKNSNFPWNKQITTNKQTFRLTSSFFLVNK